MEIIKNVGLAVMIFVIGVAIGFGITSGLVWLFLWSANLVGLTVPAFSWKICVFVYIVLLILKMVFGKKEEK